MATTRQLVAARKRAAKAAPAVTVPGPVVTTPAVKGFDRNMACRGFSYEVGKSYQHKGSIELCAEGFHACDMPLDTWTYYGPADSQYAEVEFSGEVKRQKDGDSKIVGASIHIRASLPLSAMIKRAAAWIAERAKGNLATGDSGHAAATGTRGHAAATGTSGHAAATGDSGHAAATGDSGHAAATGDSGHAAATGTRGHAAATGYSGHAAATGYSGHAAATGTRGHAAATGYSGHAAATGTRGHAAATGTSGHAAATGDSGHAAATGDSGHAAATGTRGHAAATGTRGHAAATGTRGHAAATGYSGHAAVKGAHAIAMAVGCEATAKAEAGGWLVLAAWRNWGDELVCVRAAKVGTEGIEPGKTYRLTLDGKFEKAA